MHPATDYVAEFTRDVNRAKVMSARSLMQREHGSAQVMAARSRPSSQDRKLRRRDRRRRDAPFAVDRWTGAIIGEVTPEAVIDLLAGRDRREQPRAGERCRPGGATGTLCKPSRRCRIVAALLRDRRRLPDQPDRPGRADYPASRVIPSPTGSAPSCSGSRSTFTWLHAGVAAVIDVPLQIAIGAARQGLQAQASAMTIVTLPRLSWLGIVRGRGAASAMRLAASGWRCSAALASSTSPCSGNGTAPC